MRDPLTQPPPAEGDFRLCTVGTSGTSAQGFFARLAGVGVREVWDTRLWDTRLWDTRLWGTSQMAGFAKRGDLPFLLRAVAGIAYAHRPEMTPSPDILKAVKAGPLTWAAYAQRYVVLLGARGGCAGP